MRRLSFRARILLTVIFVAVMPLVLVGWWLSGAVARSGEAMLRERMREALAESTVRIGERWLVMRMQLATIADHPAALAPTSSGAPDELIPLIGSLDLALYEISMTDAAGRILWRHVRGGAGSAGAVLFSDPTVTLAVPVLTLAGERRGTLHVTVRQSTVLGGGRAHGVAPGAVLTAIAHDEAHAVTDRPIYMREGEQWIVERRRLGEPRLDLEIAAPLAASIRPFHTAARRGVWLLLGTAALGIALTTLFTSRLVSGLRRLSEAARAIAHGTLTTRVQHERDETEIGTVARAFNTMAERLDATMAELAQRESLAAVGRFASELAHEVRNPLTSMRIDAQVMARSVAVGTPEADATQSVLDAINRLDQTVTSALTVARGSVRRDELTLAVPLESAVHAAQAETTSRQIAVRCTGIRASSIRLLGDAAALQRAFLNLLLNAAQAMEDGGEIEVEIDASPGAQTVHVAIHDRGHGIDDAVVERMFDPFFTTRADGTGLGLPLTRRIIEQAGGELSFRSREGGGTTALVTLPLLAAAGVA